MASLVRIVIKTNESSNACDAKFAFSLMSYASAFSSISRWFQGIASGARSAYARVLTGGVAATGSVTFSSIAAADTVTVNGVVFTGSNSPSTDVQFLTGTGDPASATSLAAKINAKITVGGSVYAAVDSANSSKVNITCNVPGYIGNLCSLAISAHGSVSGAVLSGGSETAAGSTVLAKGITYP